MAFLFFTNGAVFANIVPRYPELKSRLELSNAAFGSTVAAWPLGALLIGLSAGILVRRWGSARVAPATTIAMSANLVFVGIAPSWWVLTCAMFIAGSLDAIADVCVNTHGLRVERLYRRSILNSLHGVWSIGAVAGGIMGATAAGLRMPLVWHLSTAAVVFTVGALVASRFLLTGPDSTEVSAGPTSVGRPHPRLLASVGLLGVAAAMANVTEDIGATWSSVYLSNDLHTGPAMAGTAFIALQAAQTVGRLFADRVVTRFGDRAVARAGATTAGVAMTAALLLPNPVTTVVAFGLVGLGIATLMPATARAVDALPGLPPGTGLTVIGSVDRLALIAAAPLVGALADAYGLRVGLALIPMAALTVLLLSTTLHNRDIETERHASEGIPSP
ncbi:putative MFS family arabinose efflux permease [Lentzea atacamensis]|uniref:Putative MFS family arabinose efflux permease n=1 Tax=Lentzea atacamensis TaxID=531938 RepID=A0A316HK77_9PSEU|nr:putative MFS family arabinose efflux permease [Lentzea atacamensis]